MANLTGADKRRALRKAIQAHENYDTFRQFGVFDIATATMESLTNAYVSLYGFPFENGAHDTASYLPPRMPRGESSDGGDATIADDDNAADPAPAQAAPAPRAPASPIANDTADNTQQVAAAIAAALAGLQRQAPPLDESRIVELIKQHSVNPVTTINVRGAVNVSLPDQLAHYKLSLLLSGMAAGVNVMMVGPAGSGKTTAAEQAAKALELPFGFTGAINSEYKLTGFIDAQGRIVSTEFRRCYENGGVFLFDEIDSSLPAPVLAFNAALANGHADFPDGMIKRHPNFRAVAAANTFGRGADRQYVGRNQLDAATIDRWAMLDWDYDTALESALVGLPRKPDDPKPVNVKPIQSDAAIRGLAETWAAKVRTIRHKVEVSRQRVVVSPRATVNGLKLLIAGWSEPLVTEAVIWRGLDKETRQKIEVSNA